MNAPKIIVAPLEEPISVDEARAHLEAQPYEDSDVDPIDDAMIGAWIEAARERCEDFLGLSLSTRTLEIALDSFPAPRRWDSRCHGTSRPPDLGIDLPMGPVREVLSISWSDDSDGEMNNELFTLNTYRAPAQVRPIAGGSWPAVPDGQQIKIPYLAGYGVDSDGGEALPKIIRTAMLVVIAHLYEHRGESNASELDAILETLLRSRRVRLGMA